jgi:hypothetical protein
VLRALLVDRRDRLRGLGARLNERSKIAAQSFKASQESFQLAAEESYSKANGTVQ